MHYCLTRDHYENWKAVRWTGSVLGLFTFYVDYGSIPNLEKVRWGKEHFQGTEVQVCVDTLQASHSEVYTVGWNFTPTFHYSLGFKVGLASVEGGGTNLQLLILATVQGQV